MTSKNNYVTVNGNPVVTVNTAGNLSIQGNTVLTPVAVMNTAPPADVEGQLWYNTADGRTYVALGGAWVDTNPVVVPAPETYLGNIAIDGDTLNINGSTLTISNTGTLLVNGAEVIGSGGAITYMEYIDPETDYMSTLNLDYDFSVDLDDSHITLNGAGDWDIGSSNFSTKIFTSPWQGGDPQLLTVRAGGTDWTFDPNGVFTLPDGGLLLESTYQGAGSIRLRPSSGSPSQFLEIAPTFVDGDHVHLMAGSGTELYLGNDSQYVKLVNTGDVAVRADDTTSSNALWTFGIDGVLTLSTASVIQGNNADPNVYIQVVSTTTTSTWTFGIDGTLTLPTSTSVINGGPDLSIVASDGTSTTSTWVFNNTGRAELPSGLKIDLISNYAPVNGTIITQEAGQWLQIASTGTSGTLDLGWSEYLSEPGSVAAMKFNSLENRSVSIIAGSYTSTVYSWVFDQVGALTLPGLMTLPVTSSVPAITTASGTVAVCDGTGWDGGGDGLEHLMIFINDTWTVVV